MTVTVNHPLCTDFHHDPVTTARRLLGQRLVRLFDGRRLAGTIVEVEAYLGAEDRAAHSFGGRRTPRNESMYLPGGHAYVYLIYGIHHCLNVVCGKADEGVAVLIRAIEPTEGLELMARNRGGGRDRRRTALREVDLCSGPGKLAEAMAIDRALDGHDLRKGEELFLEHVCADPLDAGRVKRRPRVGVAYAGAWAEKPLRFVLEGNPHISRR